MAAIKALPGKIGVVRATEIWDILGLKDYNFGAMPFTEEEVSIKTWEGCDNSTAYNQDKEKWNRLNDAIMEFLRIDKGRPILMRVRKGNVSKICKVTKHDARNTNIRRINIAAGCITNAQVWNESLKLGMDVYEKTITTTMVGLQKQGFTAEEAKEILTQAVEARKQIEYINGKSHDEVRKELAKEILGQLDFSPKLIANDEKIKAAFGRTDKYTEESEERRNGNKDTNTKDAPDTV
jgi:hypothetical protein